MTAQNTITPTPRSKTQPPEHIPNSRYQAWADWLHSAGRSPEAIYVEAFAEIDRLLPPRNSEETNISKQIRTILWEANFSAKFAREYSHSKLFSEIFPQARNN